MSATTPKVSIAIPTRNRSALLIETLRSLQAQTYPHWEALVVDDHSTDDTAEVVRTQFSEDDRISFRIREGQTAGAPACRNQGMRASTGEYVIFLDSDDLLAPHCLGQRVKVMQERPDLDFAVFQGELFAEKPGDLKKNWNQFTGRNDLFRFLKRDVPWQTSGPIWARKALCKLVEWDESLMCWQDFDWHVRSLILGMKYVTIDTVDYYVRRSPGSADNIHVHNSSEAHLRTRVRLFRKLTKQIRAANLYDAHMRWLLTDAFFALAREWIWRQHNRQQACIAWKECLDEGVVDRFRFNEGMVGLRYFEGRKVLTKLFAIYMTARWKVEPVTDAHKE